LVLKEKVSRGTGLGWQVAILRESGVEDFEESLMADLLMLESKGILTPNTQHRRSDTPEYRY